MEGDATSERRRDVKYSPLATVSAGNELASLEEGEDLLPVSTDGKELTLKEYLNSIQALKNNPNLPGETLGSTNRIYIVEKLKVLSDLRYGLKREDRKAFYDLANEYGVRIEKGCGKRSRDCQLCYFYWDGRICAFTLQVLVVTGSIFSIAGDWMITPPRVPELCKTLFFIPVPDILTTTGTPFGYLDKAILAGMVAVPTIVSTIYQFGRQGWKGSLIPGYEPEKTVAQGITFIEERPNRAKLRTKVKMLIVLGLGAAIAGAEYAYFNYLLGSNVTGSPEQWNINTYNTYMSNPNHTSQGDPFCCAYRNGKSQPCAPVNPDDYKPYDPSQFVFLRATAEPTVSLTNTIGFTVWPSVFAYIQFILFFFKLM